MRYFVSGHRDLTVEEFKKYYVPKIDKVILLDTNPLFVVGDYWGCDIMAQDYLVQKDMAEHTIVYHMFRAPRQHNISIKYLKGGFYTDEERDAAMTKNSDFDIAFVREGKWKDSGTATNIRRRANFKSVSENENGD